MDISEKEILALKTAKVERDAETRELKVKDRELGKKIKADGVKIQRKERALADFTLCNE